MKKIHYLIFLLFSFSILNAQISPFIHVDQFGYLPDAEKVAVLSDPQVGFNSNENYTPSNELEVRNAINNQLVFTGNIAVYNNGNTEASSGDRGWWFDFSEVTQPGNYYIYDVANDERSAEFSIAENVYLEVFKNAGRMFFYNRCNFPKEAPYAEDNWTDGNNFLNNLQDANCRFIGDPNNSNLEKDLSGGWFDAGDYNKYITFTEGTLHDLLYAYEENPDAFGDDWNIPESGNSIPDIIDEIKWELDWMMKMMNDDGSVHIKMGSQNHNENNSSPPSVNTDQRFYGPTCSSASAVVANVFAHAATVFFTVEGLESYSNTLKTKAETAFNYVVPFYETGTFETDCDDLSIVAGDADRSPKEQLESFVAAAVYLYELTGLDFYNDYIVDNYLHLDPIIQGFWGADRVVVQDALFRYNQIPGGDNQAHIDISMSATIDVSLNWNGYHKWEGTDLYRSFMPDWSYYWGSNRPKAAYGSLNHSIVNNNLTNDDNSVLKKAAEHLHYFHGVNPLGMVMLSNMYGKGGDRCVNELYHLWFADGTDYDNALTSAKGPAPGYVTGGPNPSFSFTQLSPPANQPILKSYLDFNTGWPESSWEISEPAIYYQAAYLRFLANYVDAAPVSSIFENNKNNIAINISPNPVKDILNIKTELNGELNYSIFNSTGQLIENGILKENTLFFDSLNSGWYILKLKNQKGEIASAKFIIK